MMYLNSVKSVCLMLLAYLTLSVAATSCNQDEFENYEPEKKREFTKAELIEQALSRIPQTRANDNRFEMVTIKDSVTIQLTTTETIWIQFDRNIETLLAGTHNISRSLLNGYPSHYICIGGAKETIQSLTIDNNELISLEIYSNGNLTTLSCKNNHLDELDLTGCPNLYSLDVSNNELTSLEITSLSKLFSLSAKHNRLTSFQIAKEQKIEHLFITNNQITKLDLSDYPKLYQLDVANNPLSNLNLKNCTSLGVLDASFTQITDLDLSNDINLWSIALNSVPLETINNQAIDSSSFSFCTELDGLDIANTPFTKLDLSDNPYICFVNISGTSITKLDISSLHLLSLKATNSKLTDLIWGEDGLDDLCEVRIERTPFEKDWEYRLEPFISQLPPKDITVPGHLYTYSSNMNVISDRLTPRYWLINR